MIKRIILFICVVCGLTTTQARDRQCFDKNWRFLLGDSIIMARPDYDDSKWRLLDVPHDWAIEGDFYVTKKINIPFHVAEDPLRAVARGTCIALKNPHYPFLMR